MNKRQDDVSSEIGHYKADSNLRSFSSSNSIKEQQYKIIIPKRQRHNFSLYFKPNKATVQSRSYAKSTEYEIININRRALIELAYSGNKRPIYKEDIVYGGVREGYLDANKSERSKIKRNYEVVKNIHNRVKFNRKKRLSTNYGTIVNSDRKSKRVISSQMNSPSYISMSNI